MEFIDKSGKKYEISYSQVLQKQQLELDKYRASLERQKQMLDWIKVGIMLIFLIIVIYILYRLDKLSLVDFLASR